MREQPAVHPKASGPPPAVRAVADAHVFAGQDKRLQSAGELGLAQMPRIPDPVSPSQLKSANILTMPDVASVQAGLAGRSAASLEQYARNVRARELQSVDLRMELTRARMRPELGAQLLALQDNLAADVLRIRMDTAVKRQKYQFDVALLQAQSRAQAQLWTASPAKPSRVDERLGEERARLENLEIESAAEIALLRQNYTRAQDAAKAAWQEKMDTLENQEKKAALQQAQRQIDSRTAQAQRAAKEFVAGLARQAKLEPSSAVDNSLWLRAPGDHAAQAAGAQIQRSAVSIRDEILADAGTAVRLAEAVHPWGAGRWSKQLVSGQ